VAVTLLRRVVQRLSNSKHRATARFERLPSSGCIVAACMARPAFALSLGLRSIPEQQLRTAQEKGK
jgi:hypothetical protein